jgi:hypothetical protein
MAETDHSLRRLGTDYVDLYQIHRHDPTTPMEETLEAFHDVVKAGKLRYLEGVVDEGVGVPEGASPTAGERLRPLRLNAGPIQPAGRRGGGEMLPLAGPSGVDTPQSDTDGEYGTGVEQRPHARHKSARQQTPAGAAADVADRRRTGRSTGAYGAHRPE